MNRLRIAVVGCGVAGSVVLHGLRERDDVELVCFEKVATADQVDAGTGLNIGPNGLKALASLDASLAAQFAARSLPWRRWAVNLADGTPIFDLDLLRVADNPGIRIRWASLYDFLRGLVAPRVQFRSEVTDVRHGANGRTLDLQVHEGGAPRWETGFDLVIAGDGRYSMLREKLMGQPAVRHLGIALGRSLLPDESGGLFDDYTQWFSGAHRLFAFKVPGGQLYLTTSYPLRPGEPIPEAARHGDSLRAALAPAGQALCEPAAYIVDKLCAAPETLHWSRVQEADAAFHDASGRLLLVGDAAHPMAPTLGQGATQALEDAVAVVDEILRALDAPGDIHAPDAPAIGRAFAARRRERVDFVARLSWQASDSMLAGARPAESEAAKRDSAFLSDLSRMYRDCPVLRARRSVESPA